MPLRLESIEPRAWQREALGAWRKNERRGVVEVVTGGGKTIFAGLCMQSVDEDTRFTVVVPTKALVDQWFVSLVEDMGFDPMEVQVWSGRVPNREVGVVNLMVVNTARWAAKEVAVRVKTMLIVDECHRVGSPANAKALVGQYVATLGMSATPEREYDDAFRELIEPALGQVIFRYDFTRAFEDGIVSAFDMVNTRVALLADEQRHYDRLTSQIGRLSRSVEGSDERVKQLLRARARVSSRASMRVPVAAKVVDAARGMKALVFHEEIDEAERLHRLLRERGHSVTLYHSRIAANVRRDNLRLFRQGVYDVLVSCRALDEGINVPETEVAVIASASASARQRIQRLGRVLRPAPGKERALIHTLYATAPEEQRLSQEAARLSGVTEVRWREAGASRA